MRRVPPSVRWPIWAAIGIACIAMIWTGFDEMERLGRETASTGLRILGGIFGSLFALGVATLNWKAARVLRRARGGMGEIARWRVPPNDLDAFRENNRSRDKAGLKNALCFPKRSPAEGLEVIFLDDHAIIGGRVIGLATTGMTRFTRVEMVPESPLSIEFDLTTTMLVAGSSTYSVTRMGQVLRFPTARLARAEAIKVYQHFRAVNAGEVIVNPGFWSRWTRFGTGWLILSIACAAVGFAMNRPNMSSDEVILPLTLAVGGTVCAVGAIVVILIGWTNGRQQRRGGRSR